MTRQRFSRRVAFAAAFCVLSLAPLAAARAQAVDPSALDHLKCYRIKDTLQTSGVLADLTNQFGVEPGCVVMLPARALCVETEKRVISSPPPPGGGPSGTPAGHFLCYAIRCPNSAEPDEIAVEDQFGRRTIGIDKARILCAPANKLICGDGEIDPGESCDPGSAATNVCPDGSPCGADCKCPPPGLCCQCADTCSEPDGTACPPGCTAVSGANCNDDGFCETCPCGAVCTSAAGEVGVCRDTDANGACECFVPPECVCGATCVVAGAAGVCQPIAGSDICECRPQEPPCPCGDPCQTAVGPGHCQPTSDAAVCECRPDPPPECPCGTVCTNADGTVGHCQPTSDSAVCECKPDTPPECPCGHECVDSAGLAGKCRPVPFGSGLCTCVPAPPPTDCQCGKPCVGDDGTPGRCRPVHGSPGECGCVTG
jgi:hypothetical protein